MKNNRFFKNAIVLFLIFALTVPNFAAENTGEIQSENITSQEDQIEANQTLRLETVSKIAGIGGTIELIYTPLSEKLENVSISFAENLTFLESEWDMPEVDYQPDLASPTSLTLTETVQQNGHKVLIPNEANIIGYVMILRFSVDADGEANFVLTAELNGQPPTAQTEVFIVRKMSKDIDICPIQINKMDITVKTGTPDFQSYPPDYIPGTRPAAGDDYTANDNYVRSNDIITYNTKLAIGLVDSGDNTVYKNIVVRIEAKLPDVKNGESTTARLSTPFVGQTVTDNIESSYIDVAFKSYSEVLEIPLSVQVYGAQDGTVIKPDFKTTVIAVSGKAYTDATPGEVTDVAETLVSSRVNLDVKVSGGAKNGYDYATIFATAAYDSLTTDRDGKFVQFSVGVEMIPLMTNGVKRLDMKGVMNPTEKIVIDLGSYLNLASINLIPAVKTDVHASSDYSNKTKLAAYTYFGGPYSRADYEKVNGGAPAPVYNIDSGRTNNVIIPYSKYGATSDARKSTFTNCVYDPGNITAVGAPATNASMQTVTLEFKNYIISDHFPTRSSATGDTNFNIDLNKDRYFASAALLFFVPTDSFTGTGNDAYALSSTIKSNTATYDGNTFTTTGEDSFTLYKYLPGGFEVYTFDRQALSNGSYSLSGAVDRWTPNGIGTIAYGGSFRMHSRVHLDNSSPTYHGGMEMM